MENIKLFNVRTPGNLNAFSDFFDRLTSVEIVDSHEMIVQNVYTPDMPPESLNFYDGGYDSTLFLLTCRSFLLNGLFIMLLAFSNLILYSIGQRFNISCLAVIIEKINNFIFFGAINRLFIEMFADLTLCSLLNLAHMEWLGGVASVISSNILSIIWLIICIVFPIFFGFYAYINRSRWQEQGF